jgi:RNA polymerase sigma factor (sigma-70 family)
MPHFSTDEIITGIAGRKNNVIKYVYKTCYDSVRKLILMNKGNDEDVRDVFQEALFTIYQKITFQKFQIQSSFNTYLYSVCKFLWIRELSKKKDYEEITDEFPDLNIAGSLNQQYELTGSKIFSKHFNELCEDCQKVLSMYFRNISMEEICNIMGYKNIQIAKDKKYRCKKNLLTRIYNDPEYQKLKNEKYMAG